MKFEMTASELRSFVAMLATSVKANDLEIELSDAKAERESLRGDLTWAETRLERANNENAELNRTLNETSREILALKAEVQKMLDDRIPFRKERALSNIFRLFNTPCQKIQAIKALRELYQPIGLKEAKECVEGVVPKENAVRSEILGEIDSLALIFRNLGKTPVAEQCALLQPLVNVSADKLETILNGTFKVETPDIKF